MKIKWILTGLVALVAAVAVAAVAILSTMELEDLRGVIEAQAEDATGRELKVAGAIDLEISLTPAITVQDVSFANAAWGSRAEMVSVRRFELEVALLPLLSGDIRVKRLIVVEPDVLLETDKKGRGNWDLEAFAEETEKKAEEAAEEAGKAADWLSFDKVVIRDAVLTYRDGRTGEETRLHLARLEGRAASASAPLEVTIEGAYNDAPFKADGVLGSLDRLLGDGPFPVKLNAEAGGAALGIDGRIAQPMTGEGIDLRIQLRGRNLADLGALTGTALPPLGPYDLSAQVAQDGKAYRLTGLTVNIGSSDIAGNATVTLAGARPALSGSFTSGTLDLDDLAPPGADGTEDAAAGAPPKAGGRRFLFTEDPIPFEALKAFDANIKLSVTRLRLPVGLPLSDLALSLTLEEGRLAVKPFSVGFAGGKLAGEVSLDAAKTPPRLSANLSASGIDYGGLLKDLDLTDGVSGSLDAKADLRAAGASLRAIAAGLDGRIEVIGGEGSVRNDLVQAAGAGLTQMLSGWTEGGSDLRLNCLVVRLPVKGGIAAGETILLDTAAAAVGVTGTVDLRDESLKLRVTPRAKQASLLSLAVPFLVGGTLASPTVNLDPVGTVVGAAKVAGVFINPLTAGAALILESESGGENPCVAALEQSARPPAQSAARPAEKATAIEGVAKGAADTLEGVGEGITKGLKSLFGN